MSSIKALFAKLDSLHLEPLSDSSKRHQATQADVERLEALFDRKLPEAYAVFLMRYGLSAFHPSAWGKDYTVFYPVQGDYTLGGVYAERDSADVRFFLSGDSTALELSIQIEVKYARRIGLPGYWLPISVTDGIGDTLYLSLGEHDYGKLWIVARETIWDVEIRDLAPSEVFNAACFVVDSFEQFVDLLYTVGN